MSRQYRVLRQATIGSQFGTLDEVLGALQCQQPKIADALRRVDWSAVRSQVARETIAQVAAKHGVTQRLSSPNASWQTDGGAKPKGECVGVITAGDIEVALFLNADRIELAWTESHYAHDMQLTTAVAAAKRAVVPTEVQGIQKELQVAYRERALAAAMRIAAGGQQVRREELADGGVVLRVAVKGGAS
ncbi:MAG: hypothetical protein V1723_01165 [Candidatus Uhrbacteria bacterium]